MQKGFENGHHGIELLRLWLPASMRRCAPGVNQRAENCLFLFCDVIASLQLIKERLKNSPLLA